MIHLFPTNHWLYLIEHQGNKVLWYDNFFEWNELRLGSQVHMVFVEIRFIFQYKFCKVLYS